MDTNHEMNYYNYSIYLSAEGVVKSWLLNKKENNSDDVIYNNDEPENEDKYLTLTAGENNSTVSLNTDSTTIEYSVDNGVTWNSYQKNQIIELESIGDNIKFKGINNIEFGIGQFVLSGKIYGSGDVTSLINGVGGDVDLPQYAFQNLFIDNDALFTAPNLPTTTFSNSSRACYFGMFKNCVNLQKINISAIMDSKPYSNPTSIYTGSWCENVSQNGVIIVDYRSDWTWVNSSNIPYGWKIVYMSGSTVVDEIQMPTIELIEPMQYVNTPSTYKVSNYDDFLTTGIKYSNRGQNGFFTFGGGISIDENGIMIVQTKYNNNNRYNDIIILTSKNGVEYKIGIDVKFRQY